MVAFSLQPFVPGRSILGLPPKNGSKDLECKNFDISGADYFLLVASSTVIERCGWKAMDPEQFSTHMEEMMVGIARRSVRISKIDLAHAVQESHLKLSRAEASLFCEKVCELSPTSKLA